MTPFERTIASNVDTGGRPAVDPRILLALWVYATTKGETRAAEIAELCQMHKAYQWICGGVHVAEHTLSDFRVDHEEALEATHQQIVELAIGEGLVDPSVTAQDGTRIRASAGTGSFRRLSSLHQEREQVMRAVDKAEAVASDPRRSKVARAAAIRGAKDRLERIEGAIEQAQEIVDDKHLSEPQAGDKKRAPRVSTSDPEATVMKMGDGGFRPAYNVQFATAADGSGVILGVDVTMRGSDQGEMAPMLVQLEERTGQRPERHWVDAAYASHDAIEAAAEAGTTVYAPLPKKLAEPGSEREAKYSEPSRAWIDRMQSDEGKAKYKLRGEVAELTNARAKSRYGLSGLRVRGLIAACCCALLVAITANVERTISLRASAERLPGANAAVSAASVA